MITKEEKEFFEEISKEPIYYKVLEILEEKKYKYLDSGIITEVFKIPRKKLVIKLGEKQDPVPPRYTIYYKVYARYIYIVKNKKIRVQPFVKNIGSTQSYNKLMKKLNLNNTQLSKHDIYQDNVGILDGEPVIIDMRYNQHKNTERFGNKFQW